MRKTFFGCVLGFGAPVLMLLAMAAMPTAARATTLWNQCIFTPSGFDGCYQTADPDPDATEDDSVLNEIPYYTVESDVDGDPIIIIGALNMRETGPAPAPRRIDGSYDPLKILGGRLNLGDGGGGETVAPAGDAGIDFVGDVR